jgi:DNA-binding LytR/AlgR family response regulator
MTNAPVTAIIAEDEPLLQDELAEALAKLWPELAIVGRAGNGIDALRLLAEHRPTVLFLDINMPGLTGLDVAKQAASRAHVVFVTAYDQHAIAAFDQGAVDYVLKPVSLARLASTVQRLKDRIAQPPADLSGILAGLAARMGEARGHLRWVNASVGAEIRLVTVDEICYFRADGRGALAVTATAEAKVRKPIADLAEALDPDLFVPLGPATLVNVNAIARVARDVRGCLHVRLKQRDEALAVDDAYAGAVARLVGADDDAADAADAGRTLATVLFTDIVDSTAAAARLGDHAWRDLLSEHDRVSRRTIERFHGRWVKSTGDGVFATFDGPARAIRCASALGASMRDLGIALRAGVHTGECEMEGGDVRGIAVHIGARIVGLAGPGEVLVSATVRDLVGGSGIEFVDRGLQALKGVPGPVRILAVAAA